MSQVRAARAAVGLILLACVGCERNDVELRYRAERELWLKDQRLTELSELSRQSSREELTELAASYEELARRLLQESRQGESGTTTPAEIRALAAKAYFRSTQVYGSLSDSSAVERIFLGMASDFATDAEVAAEVALARGRIAEQQAEPLRARQQYELAASLDSSITGQIAAQLQLADLAAREERWMESAAILEQLAARLDRSSATPHEVFEVDLRLLQASIQAGEQLDQSLRKAEAMQAEHAQSDRAPHALLIVAEASAQRGETKLAFELADAVLASSHDLEDLPRAMLLKARLLEGAGNWAAALATSRELQIRYPVSEAALFAHLLPVEHFEGLGDLPATQAALERGEGALRDFLKSYPASAHTDLAQQLLVEVLSRLNRRNEAIVMLLEFAEHCRGTPREAALLLAAARRSAALPTGRRHSLELLDRVASRYPNTQLGAWAAQEATRVRAVPPP